jgi:hypothetical protein
MIAYFLLENREISTQWVSMNYNTRSGQSTLQPTKLNNPKQLPNRASDFYPIHRRSLNIWYENIQNVNEMLNPLPEHIKYSSYLLVNNLTRDELSLVGHRNDILNKLVDNDEKTLALYLYKVIQNDPLTTGVRESLTDSFVNFILTDLRFNRYPFLLNLQPDYSFEVFGNKVTAKLEFSIEKNKGILCFDEDKHLHGISSTTEYGEAQIAAEILACAFTNFDKADSPTREQDQTIFAIRVIGTRFTFYKAFVGSEYCKSLGDGFPPDSHTITVYRFPPNDDKETFYGYNYANENHRPIVLRLLIQLREHIRNM